MKTTHTDAVGTSNAPPTIQCVPPRPRGMPSGLIMILQAIWTEAMTRQATLEDKVGHIEGGMKPWLDIQLKNQDGWIQGRLDAFELRITRQLSSGQMPDITEIKSEVAEIKKIVVEIYDIPII